MGKQKIRKPNIHHECQLETVSEAIDWLVKEALEDESMEEEAEAGDLMGQGNAHHILWELERLARKAGEVAYADGVRALWGA